MCRPKGLKGFAPFWSENGYRLCLFGLELGVVWTKLRKYIDVFVISIPNEYEIKKYRNSKRILRNLFW